MKFTKMQGCGNDYVYVNAFREHVSDPEKLAIRVSERHFGVGSDGLILICPSDRADFRMEMYNADGSLSEMCGNGIRCVGKYVHDRGLTDKTEFTVETGSGIKTLWLTVENGETTAVRVCMGSPGFDAESLPMRSKGEFIQQPIQAAGKTWLCTAVSVGNPHIITFVDDVAGLDLERIGTKFENHELFPERVNAEFVQVVDRRTLKMRVWERGSGETMACGTGATASLAAAVRSGKCENEADLMLLGGTLHIEWNRQENLIYMTGPARFVFDGELFD